MQNNINILINQNKLQLIATSLSKRLLISNNDSKLLNILLP